MENHQNVNKCKGTNLGISIYKNLQYNQLRKQKKEGINMEEKEVVKTETEEKNALDDKGFSVMYNLTMVSAVATVAMFVIGTALYLTIVG